MNRAIDSNWAWNRVVAISHSNIDGRICFHAEDRRMAAAYEALEAFGAAEKATRSSKVTEEAALIGKITITRARL